MCSVDVCRYLNKVLCCSIYSSCDEHRGAGRNCAEVTRPVLCCAVCAVTACCCSQNKMASKSFSILCNTTDPSSVVTHSSEYFGLDCETLGIKLRHLIKNNHKVPYYLIRKVKAQKNIANDRLFSSQIKSFCRHFELLWNSPYYSFWLSTLILLRLIMNIFYNFHLRLNDRLSIYLNATNVICSSK